MSTVLADPPKQALARSGPVVASNGIVPQLRALFWKEWREQRLALLSLGAFVVLSMISYRLADLGPYDPVPYFCCLVVAWVLGAGLAGGEHVSGTSDFLTTHPLRLSLVWATKLVFGLVCVAATIGLFVVLSRLYCQWDSVLTPVAAMPLIWLSLCSFSLSHYYGCWLRSVISAMALAPLAVLCISLLLYLNPILGYLFPSPRMVTSLVLLISVALVALGRGRFVAMARRQQPLTRRQWVGWFLRPVLLLGAGPLLAGLGVLAVDLLPFEPGNVDMPRAVDVAPDGVHAVAFAPAARYTLPWDAHGGKPQAFTLSLASGVARKFPDLSLVKSYVCSLWAPDSRRVAVLIDGDWNLSGPQEESSRTVILDVERRCLDNCMAGQHAVPLVWISPRRLVVVVAGEGNRVRRLALRDVCDRTWTEIPLPESLRGSGARCWGHTVDPIQVVMSVREGTGRQIVLLGLDNSAARSVSIPSGYRPDGWLRRGIGHMILSPDVNQGTPRDESPLLLDLTSGKCVSWDRLLGESPDGGWDRAWTGWVLTDRWLLVLPREPMAKPRRGWYAVDLTRQEAFCHLSPAPRPLSDREPCLISGVLAWRHGGMVVFTDLRNPDVTASVVLVVEGGTIGCMDWLSDRELVVGFRPEPSAKDRKRSLLRTFSHGGLVAINPATKQARPIWDAKGTDVRWQFLTWREWENYRR